MAIQGVFIGLILGALLQGIQLGFDFRRELVRVDQETRYFLEGLAPSASYAVDELDTQKINSVSEAILKYPHIEMLNIRTSDSTNLLHTERKFPDDLKTKFVEQLIPLQRQYQIDLKNDEQNRPIGTLFVTVNESQALEPFFTRLSMTASMGILRILAVSLLLIFCFQMFVTFPLMKFHQSLLKVNPLKPRPLEGAEDLITRKDEIGEISRVTNSILVASQKNLQQIQDTQDLMRDYSRAASDWFWSCDENGKITYLSRPFFEHFDVSREEIYGKSIGETGMLFGDYDKIIAKFAQYIFETRENFRNFECDISDGKKISRVNLSAIAHFDQNGKFSGYRGVCTDMSKLNDMENEREILRKKLAQSDNLRAVGQLTGGIAHDFNNILSIIVGNLEAVQTQTNNSQIREHVDNSIDAATHAASLTHRLLAFSRQQPLSPEAVDISHIFSRLHKLLSDTLGENIELEFDVDKDVWACRADPHQLETAIVNLIINARDAIPKNGKIAIHAQNARYDDSEMPLDFKGDKREFLRIDVADTGSGISPKVINKIFEPFFSTKPKDKGTGLGLSMVYGFSIQSGGFLQVQSELGKGTLISLNIPRTAEIVKLRSPKPEPQKIGSLKDKKVLVVEDNTQIRQVMKMNLNMLGCETVLAYDEMSVFKAIEEHSDIEIFIFDIVLQGDDSGPEIYQKLRAKNLARPVVFMSGYTRNDIEKQILEDTNFILLSKPFRLNELAEALKAAFANQTDLSCESAKFN